MDTVTLITDKSIGNALPNQSIGAILVDSGKLTADEAERIMRLQRERGTRFGDAAIELGFLTQADIEQALSLQFDYPYLLKGESKVSEEIVAAYNPFSPQVEELRALRSQLMLRWFDASAGRKALTIISADRGEGRSFIAANLAVVFSQLGERTLLIDADMRNPRQHKLFGLDNRNGLSAILAGRSERNAAIHRVPSLIDLSVMTAGPTPPNPQELLGRSAFQQLLEEVAPLFDVILIDTPAHSECADSQMVAGRSGASLIVVRKNSSHISAVRDLVDSAANSNVVVVGSVLNAF
ncbi:chain length determinant protein tyrosine kinase EpsG [Herbaspirillum chlorophenolicum]|uniref:Chain length determinant protein tyrosine kinase EpsG n=1 Tax=Herbaspirillum chlorophenolicum TaxID=211589 RepID=A0ABW8EUZ3_9BURK|nr:chain length determinant protein tyrosine kinase EpsG [Herbaspirillum chlorophenolicum]